MNARSDAETGVTTNVTLKCLSTWKLDSNKLVHSSKSTNIIIQDMNKVPRLVTYIQISSFLTSNEVYETSRNHLFK